MFGFDWPELIIIGIVALIFIGPEDLPDMFRQLGRFTAKLRQMSREFSRAMEQAAKDTGVTDVARDLKTSTSTKSLGLDRVREAADKFEKWDPLKNAANPTAPMMPARMTPTPMPSTPPAALAADSVVTDPVLTDGAMAEEMDDDLAAIAEHEVATAVEPAQTIMNPALNPAINPTLNAATRPIPDPAKPDPAKEEFYDKLALRSQVLKEQTEKLKAIEAGTYVPEPATPPAAVPATPVAEKAEVKPAPKRAAKPKTAAAKSTAAKPAAADKPEGAAPDDAPKKSPRKKKADNA